MVLKAVTMCLLLCLAGCATTGGYERYGIYSERHDRIYEHRSSFLDDGRISMAYAIVYWDVLQIKEEGRGNIPEVFYIWLRNNTNQTILINPGNLSLRTEKGETVQVSPLTGTTSSPIKEQEMEPYEVIAGYAVFEIPRDLIESDRPNRLVYDDKAGNQTVRYLQIEGMNKYEGLILENRYNYYAPVYPRRYWYPYYYPYAYYPYDIHFFYYYAPYRHYYYFVPVEPKKREFYAPPSSRGTRGFKKSDGSREFKKSTGSQDGSSGIFKWLMEILSGGDSDESSGERQKSKEDNKGRGF